MIRVTGPRVLVALPPAEPETVTPSGIILVHDPDRAKIPTRGIVVQLGEKTGTVDLDDVLAILADWTVALDEVSAILTEESSRHYMAENALEAALKAVKALGPASFEVAVGDCVVFPAIAGEELELDGQPYVILHESDIIGVVEPQERDAKRLPGDFSSDSLQQAYIELARAGLVTLPTGGK